MLQQKKETQCCDPYRDKGGKTPRRDPFVKGACRLHPSALLHLEPFIREGQSSNSVTRAEAKGAGARHCRNSCLAIIFFIFFLHFFTETCWCGWDYSFLSLSRTKREPNNLYSWGRQRGYIPCDWLFLRSTCPFATPGSGRFSHLSGIEMGRFTMERSISSLVADILWRLVFTQVVSLWWTCWQDFMHSGKKYPSPVSRSIALYIGMQKGMSTSKKKIKKNTNVGSKWRMVQTPSSMFKPFRV